MSIEDRRGGRTLPTNLERVLVLNTDSKGMEPVQAHWKTSREIGE